MKTTGPKQPVTPVPIRECPQCGYKTHIRNEDDEFDLIVQDNAEKALEIDDMKQQVAALTKERDVAVGQFRYVAKSNEKNFNDLAAAQAREAKLRELDPLDLAIMFHHTYERLAPNMEYDTRKETRIFDHESANGKLMVAVCAELLPKLTGPSPTDDSALMERLKQEYERGYADATREGVA